MKVRSNNQQLIPYIRQELPTISLAFACTIGFTIFWPILAQLAGNMAQKIGEGDPQSLIQLAKLAVVVFLVRGLVQFGQDTLMAKAALKIALEIRKKVYRHLQTLSLTYFETAKTGDLSYRLTEDIDRIGEVINKLFHQFIPSILQLIVVLGYMVYINWKLTLATFIIAPLMAVLIALFGEQLLKFSRKSQAETSNLASILTEVFSGMRLIQAFSAEDYEVKRFVVSAEANRKAKYSTEIAKALQFVVVGFLEAMSVVLLFYLGAVQIKHAQLTGGEFVSYVAAVALLIDPIAITTSNYNEFKQGQASIDRIFELFTLKPLVYNSPNAQELPPISGKVTYENINFSYSPDSPVFTNINLSVKAGEMIALVGTSGAGKSTLMNLLLRFYNPDSGKILVDDLDIQNVTLKSLRQQMAIVPQETILFSGTIAENIAFGKENADLALIEESAKIANAHQFIMELPDGYQTYVGERGVNLSGGQRQRIAIARAVLYNPKILILDEATSALDSESEALVQEALERLMVDRTVFIIAHRLATVRRAHRILVLEKGKIIEEGTHDQLLAENGRYAKFHAQQFA